MKKIRSFALYALVTPVIALGTGSLLADQTADQDVDHEQQSTQSDQEVTISTESSDQDVDHQQQSTQGDQDATQSSTETTQSDQNTGDQSRMEHRGYMDSAPANGMQASHLIGAEVKTTNDEDVGSVNELIIDENGQVVAIVVGVGGFLGMGEKNVAIGWDDVTRSGDSDEQELRIVGTREDLSSAPKFERRD